MTVLLLLLLQLALSTTSPHLDRNQVISCTRR
jgi:hypothetical protein